MISTSGITGTGLKKCTPTTWLGALGGACDLDDGDRGGVGRQDARRLDDLVELAEDLVLQRLDLRGGLDHQVAVGELLHVQGDAHPRDGGVRLFLGDLALGDAAGDRRGDPSCAASANSCLVSSTRPSSRLGAHLCDTGTHRAATDHSDKLHNSPQKFRGKPLCAFPVVRTTRKARGGREKRLTSTAHAT